MHWDTCPNRVSGLDKAQALGIPLPHLGDGPRSQFVTVDSGQREEFESGARRDTQDGKPRYDLIAPAPLKRVAELMARGAVKYGDHNWMKGMPASRFLASLMRHVEAYRLGDRDEDHLAAAVFNALAIMHFEGTNWDDLNPS